MYSIDSIFPDGSLDDPKAANRDLIDTGRQRLRDRHDRGLFTSVAHTPSHRDETDGGNHEADRLANLARAQAIPLCPAIHMPQRYHLVHKGVPINGPKALGKHLTALHIKGFITSSFNMLEQAFGHRVWHADFLAHNVERLGAAENVIQVDFLRCL